VTLALQHIGRGFANGFSALNLPKKWQMSEIVDDREKVARSQGLKPDIF
jgi:hypothetical protein